MSKTITRSPVSLDKEHLELLTKLQSKFQTEAQDGKDISRSEVVRRALRDLAETHNIK